MTARPKKPVAEAAPRDLAAADPILAHAPDDARIAAGSPIPVRSPSMSDSPQDRNVDQIRDILFGGQMRDYERRFQDLAQRLESENTRLRQDLDKRVAQIEKRLDDHFEKLSKMLRQEVSDRTQGLDDLESRSLQAQRTLRAELQGGLQTLESELAAKDERLREELAALRQLLGERMTELAALHSRSEQDLRADKVGRGDLAALLTELALRLKGEFELPLPR